MRVDIDRTCPSCGEIFNCKHGNKKRCDECVRGSARARAAARWLKGHKPLKNRTIKCPYCKVRFKTKLWNKLYCCPHHKTLAERQKISKSGWTVADRKAYGSRYWREVTLPRLKRLREGEEAALAIADSKIPPPLLQKLCPEQIVKNWDKIR